MITIQLMIPGCTSLKEKRSRLKPLLARLHRQFNLSAAEMDRLDSWQEATIACVVVSNSAAHTRRALQEVARWIETYWPDVTVLDDQLELLL